MKQTDIGLIGDACQIKSRERVSNHGEVFTAEREVNAMLDLVKQETERIDSRFLEPACGNGNFLANILRRKLAVVRATANLNRPTYELNALLALGSLYGIELLDDNVCECRERLYAVLCEAYGELYPAPSQSAEFLSSARFILSRNIIVGDALTLMTPDESRPIVFSEWSAVGYQIKRRDFTLDMLLQSQPLEEANLFSDLGENAFIPTPCAEYPLTPYTQIHLCHDDRQDV